MVDKLLIAAFGGLMNELKSHPWTTLASAGALAVSIFTYSKAAPADAVQKVEASLHGIQVTLLESKILDAAANRCRAVSKMFFTERLATLQREYVLVAGREYRVPTCEEIGQ